MLRELAYLAKICTSDTETVCLTCFILLVYNFIKYNGVNKSHIANNYVHTQNTAYATISMAVINPILIIDNILLLSGDIETNPGPVDNIKQCLSIIHQNIRSVRNKLDYIKDNLTDFDIICLTETHLSVDYPNTNLMIDTFDKIFRKDNTSHSGGLLVYAASHLIPKRIIELETILPESIWVEIKDRSKSFLICTVYRPPHMAVEFWDRLNISIEQASEITNNIVILGGY